MRTSFSKPLLFLFIFSAIAQNLFAQNCELNTADPAQPLITKGKKSFNLNDFDTHLVMYVTKVEQEELDSLCHVFTDSLRFNTDTILVRLCNLTELGCSDTLVPPNELAAFINNSYWQKIPLNRVTKIKSRRQPLTKITITTVIVSYAVFVSAAVVSVVSKNAEVTHSASVVAGISNSIFFLGWGTNVFIAKKRFKFHKIKTYNAYNVMM